LVRFFGFLGYKKEWYYSKEGFILVYPWFGTKRMVGLSLIMLVIFCLGWCRGLFWFMFFSSLLHAKHPYLKEMKEEHEVFLGIVCGHSFA
jgi:hypothetical protein